MLSLVVHHIVFDGQSMSVLNRELSALRGGSAVALYTVRGGTHEWPGSPQATGTDRQFDASQAIWSFLAAHPAAP